jgi:Reverse transcriptase (RNA-dependent DNA polymerase)
VKPRETQEQLQTRATPGMVPEGASAGNSRKRIVRTLVNEEGTLETREDGTNGDPVAAKNGDDGPTSSQGHYSGSNTGIQGPEQHTKTTRSGRKAKPRTRLIEAMIHKISLRTSRDVTGEIFSYQAMFPDDRHEYDDPLHIYKAVSDPDTLYYHEAMREQDKDRFQESMLKKITNQFENGNFTVIHKSQAPEGQIVLPAVWQMRRKQDVRTGAIKKYKAVLNIDGSRMKQGVHYSETYAPVASWNSIRMLLILIATHGWHTVQSKSTTYQHSHRHQWRRLYT